MRSQDMTTPVPTWWADSKLGTFRLEAQIPWISAAGRYLRQSLLIAVALTSMAALTVGMIVLVVSTVARAMAGAL